MLAGAVTRKTTALSVGPDWPSGTLWSGTTVASGATVYAQHRPKLGLPSQWSKRSCPRMLRANSSNRAMMHHRKEQPDAADIIAHARVARKTFDVAGIAVVRHVLHRSLLLTYNVTHPIFQAGLLHRTVFHAGPRVWWSVIGAAHTPFQQRTYLRQRLRNNGRLSNRLNMSVMYVRNSTPSV